MGVRVDTQYRVQLSCLWCGVGLVGGGLGGIERNGLTVAYVYTLSTAYGTAEILWSSAKNIQHTRFVHQVLCKQIDL